MDLRKPRHRIWNGLKRTERMSLYYSRRSRQLEKKFKGIVYVLTALPALAFGLAQFDWEIPNWVIPLVLVLVGIAQIAVIHYGVGNDIKAAKIMAHQSRELASQWRELWINQDRPNITQWIDVLERQAIVLTTEEIEYDEEVNDECFEEVEDALAAQFGGQKTGAVRA